ncbi:MAG: hypothetical protein GEV07_14680 [Streptosporangiales bacterium]|nr:hypothetical protein [Streptosporangiales bacterium]
MAEEKQEAPDTGESDDLHRKFREALERKKNSEHNTGDSPREQGKSAGPSDAKVKRRFRRKSG